MKELEELQNNENFLRVYGNAVDLLRSTGILKFLIERGRVSTNVREPNLLVFEAARSAGYNECLDDIFKFKEKYLLPLSNKSGSLSFDFGSSSKTLNDGDLTEEELNAIKSGTKPTYNPIPVSTDGRKSVESGRKGS